MKSLFISAIAGAIALFSTPVCAETTLHIDAATITKNGSGTQAIILIPGLGCGPSVYSAVLPELTQRYTVYAVSFAGFDGNAPTKPPYLDAFTRSVADLIAQEHLTKPIIIGHSLGGHIAIHLAELAPQTIGAVLAIDTLPLFPPSQPGEKPEDRQTRTAAFVHAMESASKDDYAASARRNAAYLAADRNVDEVTRQLLRGDQITEARVTGEMMTEDLRPDLTKITAPLEVLVPVPTAALSATMVSAYTAQYAGTKNLTAIPIVDSKHFIMLDQPAAFRTALDTFLAANATNGSLSSHEPIRADGAKR